MASLSVAILVIVAFSAFFSTSQGDTIGDVCKKSVNPSLCNRELRSDPKSRSANLAGLGRIAIQKAVTASIDTIRAAKSVRNSGNSDIVDTCVETCGDAIDTLNECSKLLPPRNRGESGDLKTKASAALTDVGTCDDEFDDDEPARVKAASRRAQDLIDVLLVVANRL